MAVRRQLRWNLSRAALLILPQPRPLPPTFNLVATPFLWLLRSLNLGLTRASILILTSSPPGSTFKLHPTTSQHLPCSHLSEPASSSAWIIDSTSQRISLLPHFTPTQCLLKPVKMSVGSYPPFAQSPPLSQSPRDVPPPLPLTFRLFSSHVELLVISPTPQIHSSLWAFALAVPLWRAVNLFPQVSQ